MEWVRGEAVGRGSFGSVNLAKPRKQGTRFPQLMAVKSCGSSHSASLMNEKSVLEQLSDCPQIIRCFGGDSSFESGEKLSNLLLEYASGGSLAERVKNSAPAWRCSPDDDVCKLLMRIGVGDQIPDIPGNISAEGKDFLEKCFVRDPAKRWTAEMLLNHPFVIDQVHDDDDHTVPLDDTCEPSTSGSPTGPFDFPGWESPCSITSLPSREYSWDTDAWSPPSESNLASAERLRRLATEGRPDWSVSEGWVAVRW
ncbi:hypothetical protein C3L33_01249, partial [Rhododendron williamsianum]